MNKNNYVTLYLCNGKSLNCPNYATCKSQNYPTDCKHTMSKAAAEFGTCDKPWLHPDRFKTILLDNGQIQYWERYPIDQLYHYCDGNFVNRDVQVIPPAQMEDN